jgi:hypothetical protein
VDVNDNDSANSFHELAVCMKFVLLCRCCDGAEAWQNQGVIQSVLEIPKRMTFLPEQQNKPTKVTCGPLSAFILLLRGRVIVVAKSTWAIAMTMAPACGGIGQQPCIGISVPIDAESPVPLTILE